MGKITYEGDKSAVVAGDYILGIEDASCKMAAQSGNEQVKLTCRVLREDGTKGPVVFDYLIFSEKTTWKFSVFLNSIGRAPSKVGAELDVTDAWLKANVVGAMGWASLKQEEYQGKVNNKVVNWLSAKGRKDPYATLQKEVDSDGF